MIRPLLTIFLCSIPAIATADESGAALRAESDWSAAVAMVSTNHRLQLLDAPRQTELRGSLGHGKAQPENAVPPPAPYVDLKFDWLSSEPPTDFQQTREGESLIRSTCRVGKARITRTYLVDPEDGSVLIHLLANMPGALSFRVSLSGTGEVAPRIEDRRELIRTVPDGVSAHVRVVPFESDVSPDGKSILVRGEGEALILLSYAAGADAPKTLAETWKRLAQRHDPGNNPPDPVKIWHAVLGERLKSIENSP
ncbi:MAG: hypothetical protein V4640_05430 [Verrucomicrobiota bacterium]